MAGEEGDLSHFMRRAGELLVQLSEHMLSVQYSGQIVTTLPTNLSTLIFIKHNICVHVYKEKHAGIYIIGVSLSKHHHIRSTVKSVFLLA